MLGLKYFIRVQTFWRRPFVASRNFCHPGTVLGRAILQARSTCDQMWIDGPQVQDMGHCQLIKDVMTKMLESYVFSYKAMLKNKKSKCNDFFEWNYNSCDLWGIIPGEVALVCSSIHWSPVKRGHCCVNKSNRVQLSRNVMNYKVYLPELSLNHGLMNANEFKVTLWLLLMI